MSICTTSKYGNKYVTVKKVVKAVVIGKIFISGLILENRQYLHFFKIHFICSLLPIGTEEWTG